MENDDNISKILLENNVDKNLKDVDGNTPLHLSIDGAISFNLVRLLLASDVDINAKNNKGDTPLHLFVLERNLEDIKVLIRSGAEPFPRNNEGKTPLDLATEDEIDPDPEIASFLRSLRKRPFA